MIPEQCESSLLLKFAVVPTSLDRGVCLGAPTHKVRPRFEAVNAKLKAISFSLMVIARKMHRDLIQRFEVEGSLFSIVLSDLKRSNPVVGISKLRCPLPAAQPYSRHSSGPPTD